MSTILDTIRGNKAALAQALARLEREPWGQASTDLLNAAWEEPSAQVVGLTGPPGVGKSTLAGAVVAAWRAQGRTVGVIAVDPSSSRSGGALLGDRVRIATAAEDPGAFVRSMAARDRLGGLASLTWSAMVLMRALFDRVLIETVGVGQSETDVTGAADTVVFCAQPASGDSLQFMKAGIVEIPHIAVVTKADLGDPAQRAASDLKGALSLADHGDWIVPVLLASAATRSGIDDLVADLDRHFAHLVATGQLAPQRDSQAQAWLHDLVRTEHGRRGLARLGGSLRLRDGQSPFAAARASLQALDA
ncbi:ArgK/MeaB family GTPase [Zavarzinia sp. CC-PAN008]|uniref:ArgK/MeaB family GTPase n=1 Tax=Zavarzinia sp. CC-PAN008 TaxID=3243332 RepID=UPI003F746282